MLKSSQLFQDIKMGQAFLTLVKDPSRTEKIFELSQIGLESPDQRAAQAVEKHVMSQPGFAALYEERYLPAFPDLEELALMPAGTLGRRFYEHMNANHLSLDFFPVIRVDSAIKYISMRMRQTHDIWHVVCGYDTSVEGELGLQAFMLAQVPSALSASLLSAGLLHFVKNSPGGLPSLMNTISEGYLVGKKAAFLPSQKWEQLWNQPVETIRRDLKIERFAS
jgi:ubiquinone biosynthesis protein Coq4